MVTKTATGSERVARLREKMLVTPEVCIERARLMTESYRETESQPPLMRRALALEKILREMTIRIEDDELIVGTATSKRRAGSLTPEINWEWYLGQMDSISAREWDRFAPLSEEEKRQMREFLPYWRGRSLYDKWRATVPEELTRFHLHTHLSASPITNMHLAHCSPGYEKILTMGLKGLAQRAEEELAKLDLADIDSFKKSQFLKAVKITLAAVQHFAGRYAGLARDMAEKENDSRRQAELLRIAETCAWVPANPARSFYEAMQSIWLAYIVVMLEGWGPGISFGRPDQYLYPFYKRDIEEGRITREEARELISLFYIKLNGLTTPFSDEFVRSQPGYAMLSNLTLGGATRDGKDAVNELSYLFLEAEEDVRLSNEDIVIRVNKLNPDAFLIKACQIANSLRGKLKFVSDDTAIPALLSDGKPVPYARDYVIVGCFIPTVPAGSLESGGEMLNLPMMLELALNNGVSRLTGEQMGPKTGDPRKFRSYEEVWEAYKKQVAALIRQRIPSLLHYRQSFADHTPSPFQSSLFNGCLESGTDITNGGTAPQMSQAIWASASPNVGDSLAAIKKAVFEDKKITMSRLIDALDRNFEGEDEVLHVLKRAPKFGNDDDYVDSIVKEVLAHAAAEVSKYRGFGNSICNTAASTVTANLPLGYAVGALPDGRKAGEPLSEGGISPYQGRNISGPAATIRSVTKCDLARMTGGSVLNMRFHPDTLKGEDKMRKFASLIRTFCETGGYLVQFNITDSETLKDAQKNPDKHRDLLVRVATYSAYFVDLPPELQNDIIARTEFQEI